MPFSGLHVFPGGCCSILSAVKRGISQLDGRGRNELDKPEITHERILQVQSMMADPNAVDKLQKIMQ